MVHHDIHGHPCIEERFLCVFSGVALCWYMHIPAHTYIIHTNFYIYMCVHLPAFFPWIMVKCWVLPTVHPPFLIWQLGLEPADLGEAQHVEIPIFSTENCEEFGHLRSPPDPVAHLSRTTIDHYTENDSIPNCCTATNNEKPSKDFVSAANPVLFSCLDYSGGDPGSIGLSFAGFLSQEKFYSGAFAKRSLHFM